MSEICMAQGATSPARLFTLQDGAGLAVDFGAGSVAVRLEGLDTAYLASRAAVIVDAEAGIVRYDPLAADTAAPGLYRLDFEVTFDDGTREVFPVEGPLWMDVRPRA